MKITLRPDEVALSHLIGRNRSLIARASGVVDAKIGDQDGAEADVMGFLAEYAVAKALNVFLTLDYLRALGRQTGGFWALTTM